MPTRQDGSAAKNSKTFERLIRSQAGFCDYERGKGGTTK
jgi:hypothetical protein